MIEGSDQPTAECRDCCYCVSGLDSTAWCMEAAWRTEGAPSKACQFDGYCDEFILYKGAADDD